MYISKSVSLSPNGLAGDEPVAPSSAASSRSFSKSKSRSSASIDRSAVKGLVIGLTLLVSASALTIVGSSASKAPRSNSSFCAKSEASSKTGSLNSSTSDGDDELMIIFSPEGMVIMKH